MKRYIARVYIPIVYEIYTETKEEAAQIAMKGYVRLKQKGNVTIDTISWAEPEIEIEEQETI